MDADEILDCIGLICPMPIVKMAKRMRSLEFGRILLITADDEGAKSDIPAWCAKTGNEFLGMNTEGEITSFYVKKVS